MQEPGGSEMIRVVNKLIRARQNYPAAVVEEPSNEAEQVIVVGDAVAAEDGVVVGGGD